MKKILLVFVILIMTSCSNNLLNDIKRMTHDYTFHNDQQCPNGYEDCYDWID